MSQKRTGQRVGQPKVSPSEGGDHACASNQQRHPQELKTLAKFLGVDHSLNRKKVVFLIGLGTKVIARLELFSPVQPIHHPASQRTGRLGATSAPVPFLLGHEFTELVETTAHVGSLSVLTCWKTG